MPILNSVVDMQSATAMQQAQEYQKMVSESSKDGRNVGGMMGKNDFLMLLAAQLRYQDPLEPQGDADFAAQLAQFTSLEQMQNMNDTLSAMNSQQSYSLVGKFVMAEAYIDGQFVQIAGVVDSVFVKSNVIYAQIGQDVVPVSSITEVFDTNNLVTSEMFMQTANMLIGKTVIAEVDGIDIEGIVTRVLVDGGNMFAQIDDGTFEPKFVPVNTIVDIRETGSRAYGPKPDLPPDAINFREDPDSDGFIEYADDLVTPIGRWDWSNERWQWVYTQFETVNNENDDIGGESAGSGGPGESGGAEQDEAA